MEPIYTQTYDITDIMVDCHGRLRASGILYIAQDMGGRHCTQLALDYETLASRRLFWAVTRHRVQVTRIPTRGERIRVETWPMPTTRVAYPRSVVAYDESGAECFRAITLWVLMNLDTRNMILPGKSGIQVTGTLRGLELASPTGLVPRQMQLYRDRTVCYTDLDRNGHMNNTRYLDWIDDLLPSAFHAAHSLKEFTVCYLAECREGDALQLRYDATDAACVQVDAYRRSGEEEHRVFSARVRYGE